MTFDDVKNNGPLIKKISESAARGNVSHAYVFEGSADTDKKTLADCFAKALLCGENPGIGCEHCIVCKKINHGNHEDVIYVEKDENSVKDEAIEELQERLKKKPFAGERNIAVVMDADTMTRWAQNRLLKTLEEPFPGTVIILLSENAQNLNKTVLSRCVTLRWSPFHDTGLGELATDAEFIVKALLEEEPFYLIKSRIMRLAGSRDDAFRLLDSMETVFGGYVRERMYDMAVVNSAIRCIEEARQDLKYGMNTGYVLKGMILKMEDKKW